MVDRETDLIDNIENIMCGKDSDGRRGQERRGECCESTTNVQLNYFMVAVCNMREKSVVVGGLNRTQCQRLHSKNMCLVLLHSAFRIK